MLNKTQYRNATFTKRVDHEAGRHHTLRALSEPATCEDCGAVYANRRWTAANKESVSDWMPGKLKHAKEPPRKHAA